MTRHVYQHTFRNDVRATATLTDDPPHFAIEWDGRPSRAMVDEYLKWRKTILADFTERTGKKVLVVDIA